MRTASQEGPVYPKSAEYRGRVLVIDDNADARNAASTILQSHGFDVLVARNGQEGLSFYRGLHAAIDAVLLDMRMSGADATETYRRLHAINPAVKAIVCLGDAFSPRIHQTLILGASAFLPNPFAPADLIFAVSDAIGTEVASARAAENGRGGSAEWE